MIIINKEYKPFYKDSKNLHTYVNTCMCICIHTNSTNIHILIQQLMLPHFNSQLKHQEYILISAINFHTDSKSLVISSNDYWCAIWSCIGLDLNFKDELAYRGQRGGWDEGASGAGEVGGSSCRWGHAGRQLLPRTLSPCLIHCSFYSLSHMQIHTYTHTF